MVSVLVERPVFSLVSSTLELLDSSKCIGRPVKNYILAISNFIRPGGKNSIPAYLLNGGLNSSNCICPRGKIVLAFSYTLDWINSFNYILFVARILSSPSCKLWAIFNIMRLMETTLFLLVLSALTLLNSLFSPSQWGLFTPLVSIYESKTASYRIEPSSLDVLPV